MATPMIDDIELKAVQYIRQETDQDFTRQRVAGLSGTLHQKLGRASHRVVLTGYLLPATATDDLKKLQDKASSGDEVTFTADITTALSRALELPLQEMPALVVLRGPLPARPLPLRCVW